MHARAQGKDEADTRPLLVLASASPRRRELLARAGIAFETLRPEVAERRARDEAPEAFARRLALDKARDVAGRLGPARTGWVLGSDTIVVRDEDVLGKPADADDAVRMLASLVGRSHEVLTAVALVPIGHASPPAAGHGPSEPPAQAEVFAVRSRVAMRPASTDELRAYAATGEPLDKAGAYALQGAGRRFVTHVEGSESNVIGLPLERTLSCLERLGGFRAGRH